MSKTSTKPKMRDGVTRRGATWSYVIRVLDAETGKTKPKWVGGFKTQREAKTARAAALAATARGTYVERKSTTLGEWLDTWLDAHSVEVRANTLASYRFQIRRYVEPYAIAHRNLQQLTPSMLSAHWREVHEHGSKDGGPLSVRTVRYAHTVVRKALSDAVQDRRLEVNPATGTKLPKQQRATGREPDAWTPEALRDFLQSTTDNRLHPLWVLLAYTGIRRGEALALRWSDVNLDEQTVHVRRSAHNVGNGPQYDMPKNGEARAINAASAALDALRTWRKTQAEERLAAGPAYVDDEGLVFTMPDGRPVDLGYATKAFAAAVRTADVDRITLHGLRHTAATLLLRDGAPITAVSKMLGHKDVSVTLDVYSHVLPQDGAELAARMGRIVGG